MILGARVSDYVQGSQHSVDVVVMIIIRSSQRAYQQCVIEVLSDDLESKVIWKVANMTPESRYL